MNILYLCDEYPPGQHGGIGTSVQLLARQMAKMGHHVVVAGLYSLGYGGDDEFEDKGVKVYRFRMGWDSSWIAGQRSMVNKIVIRLLTAAGLMQSNVERSLGRYTEKLNQLIADNHIDIVEMPDYNDYTRFCTRYLPFPVLPAPVIVKLHGSLTYFSEEAGKKIPEHIYKIERAILNQAAAVSSVSKYTAVKSAAYFSYKQEIEVLYNGIDTDIPECNIYRHPKQVVFVGSLAAKKGIYQLAKAWNIVYNTVPDAQLFILGKGPQQAVTQYLSEEAIKTVSFKGHVSAEYLYNILLSSAISVFPSYAEAFPLAPLEAMVCGTAVIGSNRTSGSELIDNGINGLLIDPDNVEDIAFAILYFLKNPEACASFSKTGNEKVRTHFDVTTTVARNIQFYNKMLKK